ncbi:MAG: class I SAM-dependent methyltransferase [Flavobacteriales bacterium]|jgi:ubiquinone/menaquinone biosynthesis C-methylase UbiE|nr:class I SAM-dependent methyltransferase [Flavobacteriales bacterium]
MNNQETHTYPVEKSGGLDSKIRRILQDPYKLLNPYVQEGMTVLDLGCGPGYFTIPLARIVGDQGVVVAVDIQEEMFKILKDKFNSLKIKNIKCVNTSVQSMESIPKIDFALAAYVMHELSNLEDWVETIYNKLDTNGLLLVFEPNIVVSKKAFRKTQQALLNAGFVEVETPKIRFSKSILVQKK